MPRNVRVLPRDELEFQMFVLDEAADRLRANGIDIIKLTIGISELPIPDRVQGAFLDALVDFEKTHLVYPEGLPELRAAIADYYETRFGALVEPRNVIVNTGTSPLFRTLFHLLNKPGQQVLLPRPYYSLYKVSAVLADARLAFYDIDLRTLRVDLDSFADAYDPATTTIVVLNSPGNPLGNVLTRHEIETIFDIVDGRSYVIADEIYNNVCFYEPYRTPLAYLSSAHKAVTVVTNGFSKGFRMYTKRVGYALLPDELVTPLRIVQQHTLLTHDPVSQFGMIEALKDEQSPRELCSLYQRRAEYAHEQLSPSRCRPILPQGGFYVVLDCEEYLAGSGLVSAAELAHEILDKVGVATVPGTDFGLSMTLRLSLCSNRFEEGIDRLRDYFTAPGSPIPVVSVASPVSRSQ